MTCRALIVALLLASSALPLFAAEAPLTTVSERSGFIKTGRYDEVIALCDGFAKRYPTAVRCETFGTTPQGRPMKLLVASTSGALSAQAAMARKLPVTLIQGGIHAGEIDGKDAGFLALRQILDGEAGKDVLKEQVLLFVPVFNADGHERFKAWNRPNQRGPEEMGWRTTAQNYNLNRDYAKADAPEMQAMLGLLRQWDPLAYVDLHVTDGAKFEHDVSIQVEPVHAGDAALREVGRALRDGTVRALTAQGAMPLTFYPSFVRNDEPDSGFVDEVSPPRFSTGYLWLRNRLAMLVETHAWRTYPYRVQLTRNTILAVLDQMATHGAAWRTQALAADMRASAIGTQPVPLDYRTTDKVRMIDFHGYAYTRTPSSVSGAMMTRYDETTPQVWTIPLRDEIVAGRVVSAPGAGYIVPSAYAARVAALLRHHGVNFRSVATALPDVNLQIFRADEAQFSARSLEGHQRLELKGQWQAERQDIAAGAIFVPINQPLARLVMALLEPQAPDAMAAWGEFNNAFERKEYMEDYVAEDVAREMLAKDPSLKAEFEKRLRNDTVFAASPEARLTYFARRHASWDTHFNRYPVMRVDHAPQ